MLRPAEILLAIVLAFAGTAYVQNAAATDKTAPVSTAAHGFDFEFGDWRVRHRVKQPGVGQQWIEFDGTCTTRSIMGGAANVEDHKFDKPAGVTRGVALRAYDAKTGKWAIWWVDSRNPHSALDPPVVGRFENGIGTFYSESVVDGKSIRTRFVWSQITAVSAHWEQAYSSDAGKTWETNWIMDFQRVQPTGT